MAPDQARRTLLAFAAVAAGIGAVLTLLPAPALRLAGMECGRRSLYGTRLFGIRELALGYGLARAARERDAGRSRLLLEIVALAQAGDIAVTTAMRLRGSASWRAALAVWVSAPPTLVAALAARAALSP